MNIVDYSDSEGEEEKQRQEKLKLEKQNKKKKALLVPAEVVLSQQFAKIVKNQNDMNANQRELNIVQTKLSKIPKNVLINNEHIENIQNNAFTVIKKDKQQQLQNKLDNSDSDSDSEKNEKNESLNVKRNNPYFDIVEQQANIEKLDKYRKVAHLEGQFSGYIYIDLDYKNDIFQKLQEKMINAIEQYHKKEIDSDVNKTYIHRFFDRDKQIQELQYYKQFNFHISLCKTFYLSATNIDLYRQKALQLLPLHRQCVIGMLLRQIELYKGDTGKLFLAIKLQIGKQNLDHLVDTIDKIQEEFGQESFFKKEDRSFHISLMWTTKNLKYGDEIINLINQQLRKDVSSSDSTLFLTIKDLKLKIGQRITLLPLKLD